MSPDRAASLRARLLALAKARGDDFNLILNRYAIERWLYRLSISEDRDRLWLKGATLFALWMNTEHRPTRDADFLGSGSIDSAAFEHLVARVTAIPCDDGIEFDSGAIVVQEIREEARYGGLRAKLVGNLARARCTLQLDVGYGDAVTPGPEEIRLPTLHKDLPAPQLKGYPRATVAAEKLEAIVHLGMTNTRMKDFYDLHALSREAAIDPEQLGRAIAATFTRRQTPLPADVPVGLSSAFSRDESRRRLWLAFLERNRLEGPPLDEVVDDLARFVQDPFAKARRFS